MVVAPRPAARILQDHPVQWRTASPLWRLAKPTDNARLLSPAILRFTTDTFMEDFLTVAAQAPQRLGEWQVQRETWRKPAPMPPLPPTPASLTLVQTQPDPILESQPLKLFQPAHQRYYLVTASLICRIPGLPDKSLNLKKNERVLFVVRRMMQDEGNSKEHAFVGGVWQPIEPENAGQQVAGEQTFPMFPTVYSQADGYTRRIFAGLVPVSNREAFLNAGRQPAPAIDGDADMGDRIDHLITVLNVDIIGPWLNINRLREQEEKALPANQDKLDSLIATLNTEQRSQFLQSVHIARDKLQTASWYTLLDLAYYLRDHLPSIWDRIATHPDTALPAGTPGKALLDTLQTASFKPEISNEFNSLTVLQNKFQGIAETTGATSLAKALQAVYAARDVLETTTQTYNQPPPDPPIAQWPTTLFLLCGQRVKHLVNLIPSTQETNLAALIREALMALPPDLTQRVAIPPLAKTIAASTDTSDYDNDLFLIRCVYERPNCPPALHPTVVSQPTQLFQMASYFDPDAPARPIRIPMPIDTTPAGLRKFAKNTMFVMSDTLACQVEKARDLTFGDLVLSVLPWPFHKDLSGSAGGCPTGKLNFGKICTLSIPIITLCALILLIIIVSLLDIIFRWVPYLIFCLPLPGLKAKK